jgi:hypothetical protein
MRIVNEPFFGLKGSLLGMGGTAIQELLLDGKTRATNNIRCVNSPENFFSLKFMSGNWKMKSHCKA